MKQALEARCLCKNGIRGKYCEDYHPSEARVDWEERARKLYNKIYSHIDNTDELSEDTIPIIAKALSAAFEKGREERGLVERLVQCSFMWSNSRCIAPDADVMFTITWTMLGQLLARLRVVVEVDRNERVITNFMEICFTKYLITPMELCKPPTKLGLNQIKEKRNEVS